MLNLTKYVNIVKVQKYFNFKVECARTSSDIYDFELFMDLVK